ncbi:ATP-binding protein [Rhodomicrobium udaipurense JA643]|uniref:AAA family ATPase n=1 Tax=Rhodomicrobium udaipurense TaxID=1202716 RepID=A0A8I1GCA1_9HYPH|nr:AAA family ATPase [Rhodomicrobium udaipurense]KAI95706.1 ATP-binding protein [Rhodomicrobium udaipurense JA643]MBJ7542249.1 AAA family ATPase [Rhodomicrobium udaipurense]
MKIRRLSVAHLRAFEQAQFEFDPAFTLLVGVNGVGKTTVLETLRICLSRLLPKFTASKSRPDTFVVDDIQVGTPAMTVDLDLTINGEGRHLLIHKQREQNVSHKSGVVREQTLATPDRETFSPDFGKAAKALKTAKAQSVAVYFATRRSLVSDEQPKSGKASGGQAVAFADALVARPLRLAELATWMHAQEALSRELLRAGLHLAAMRAAARRFLPDCEGLRAEMEGGPRLLIEKHGRTLDVRQLSDGERSMLALVLDLARRLSQANPGLDDPVRDGVGLVLIDELDMHMHPLWQRQVMSLLTGTFPNCQFVATTHSPQIIGETQPERIILLQAEEGRIVPKRCGQAYGLDTNYILEHLMGTPSRPEPTRRMIAAIEASLDEGDLDPARSQLAALRTLIRGDDPTVAGLEATINNLEALGDASDQ